jgi:uncharacterized protein YjbJ (UPF0337 family)
VNNEQVSGAAHNMAGKVQQAVGSLAGDQALKVEGAVREAAGKATQAIGDSAAGIKDAAQRNPVAAAMVGVGAGLLLGLLLARRGD